MPMLTAREELLAVAVNDRIARQKKADRWWWLGDWQDWFQGACWGLSSAVPLGMYFWLSPSSKGDWTYLVPLALASAVAGVGMNQRFRKQQKTIERLEERVRSLEEERDR